MLKTLKRIVQEVNSAGSLEIALQIMVKRVQEATSTRASSLFLVDRTRSEYVLMATEGLNQSLVGQTRVKLHRGLVGLVGNREEPINLVDANQHPDFLTLPHLGEEVYRAYLGVPIIHHRHLLGVLAIQDSDERSFDEEEEAFLVTIAAQLAVVLAHANATGQLKALMRNKMLENEQEDLVLTGIPCVPGVGIGQAIMVYPKADLEAVPERPAKDKAHEIDLFSKALVACREDIHRLGERLKAHLPQQEFALFDVYLRILDDDSLGVEVIDYIKKHGVWAQTALQKVIKQHVAAFNAMEDEYLRDRASDVRDLGHRVLNHLQTSQPKRVEYPEKVVLVGDEITAASLAEVPEGRLFGIVSNQGSTHSHVSILARSLGVPAVMSTVGKPMHELNGELLIVDGYVGHVYISPNQPLLLEYQRLLAEEHELTESLSVLRNEPAVTPDGHRILLKVNTGLPMDAGLSLSVGAEGVGLYRTEVPFMTRDRFPAEEEQKIIYRQLLKAFAPHPVTMRTLDIGGDKMLPYFPIEEINPFLGWRGIRVTLDHPEIFLLQVRAMLAASASLEFNNLRIMLPMINCVGEVDEALNLIHQAFDEVSEEVENLVMPPVGVMVEVPAAVYQARELAKRVDFLSVGSNDLTQYLLAVDRNNARVSNLFDSLHPAMIHALIQVVEGAHAEGKTVSICGEMAGEPISVILLLAIGFDSLSMNSTSLPRIKWVIRHFPLAKARKLLSEVLVMESAPMIRLFLQDAIFDAGLGGLIRAGKQ